jgi:hypothetical protein
MRQVRIHQQESYVSMVYHNKADKIIMIGGQTGHPEHPEGASGAVWIYDVAANQWSPDGPTSGVGKKSGNCHGL